MAGLSADASAASVTVIVPVFRDLAAVRALFDAAEKWSPPAARVVVVSGERDAALARLTAARGHVYVDGPANRGAQLDLGAGAAESPVLWFVHADAVVPPDAIAAIRLALAGGAESGCFRFSFQGPRGWHKAALERLVALRVRFGGIPYGDQALFATRAAYAACGGFAHVPLFEEVRLVRCLRRRGTFRVLPERVAVSTRRWERDGWVRRTVQNRWLALRHALGAEPERLADDYAAGHREHAQKQDRRRMER
jgi:rSAM/selenodomain-associated transferase 2